MTDADRDLSTATILVTGATGVLGRQLTERLVAEGANVIASGRTASRVADLPRGARGVAADFRDPGSVAAILNEVGDNLTGWINAAGVVAFGPVEDLSADTLQELLEVNAIGPLRLTTALLPRLSDGGFIAHMTGVIAAQPMAGLAAYGASKAALSSSLTALRRELRGRKIDVIDLQAPHTETGLVDRAIAGDPPKLPQGADPADIVETVLEAVRSGARDVTATAFTRGA